MRIVLQMLYVFVKPTLAFNRINARPHWKNWVIPVCFAIVTSYLSLMITFPLMQSQQYSIVEQSMKQSGDTLTEQEKEEFREVYKRFDVLNWVLLLFVTPVIVFMAVLVVAVVVKLVDVFYFGGEAAFLQCLSISAHAGLIGIAESIFRTVLILYKQSMDVQTNLGLLVSSEMRNTSMGNLLNGISLFDVWQTYLIGIGLSIIGCGDRLKSLAIMFVCWVFWVLTKASLNSLIKGIGDSFS